jgi:hypothetical protein
MYADSVPMGTSPNRVKAKLRLHTSVLEKKPEGVKGHYAEYPSSVQRNA